MGLRDFGTGWAELYRVADQPPSYLVLIHSDPKDQPDFSNTSLELDGRKLTTPTAGGACLLARAPLGGPVGGRLRLFAERRDGTILMAQWN